MSPKGTARCQAPQSPWAHQGIGLNVPEKAVGRTGWAEAQVPFLLVQRPVPQFCQENWSSPPVTSRLTCHSCSFLIPTPGHWVSTHLCSVILGQRLPLLILILPSLPPSPVPLTSEHTQVSFLRKQQQPSASVSSSRNPCISILASKGQTSLSGLHPHFPLSPRPLALTLIFRLKSLLLTLSVASFTLLGLCSL